MSAIIRWGLISMLVVACGFSAPPLRRTQLESLRVKHKELPLFPEELLRLGEREGEVRVAFSVDVNGRIDDYLVVASTHPEFARMTVAALKKWTFEPAMLAGTPVPASTEIGVKFEAQGTVVISMTGADGVSTMVDSMLKGSYNYRAHALRELDAIPTPIEARVPVYGDKLVQLGHVGDVTVDFYIDETGSVRMPSVNADEDSELASIALTALRTWKFEPPTCKGVPVLVRANQVFRFRPGATVTAEKRNE
jgi:TonB family protein